MRTKRHSIYKVKINDMPNLSYEVEEHRGDQRVLCRPTLP